MLAGWAKDQRCRYGGPPATIKTPMVVLPVESLTHSIGNGLMNSAMMPTELATANHMAAAALLTTDGMSAQNCGTLVTNPIAAKSDLLWEKRTLIVSPAAPRIAHKGKEPTTLVSPVRTASNRVYREKSCQVGKSCQQSTLNGFFPHDSFEQQPRKSESVATFARQEIRKPPRGETLRQLLHSCCSSKNRAIASRCCRMAALARSGFRFAIPRRICLC
jgi:hypothetical protein